MGILHTVNKSPFEKDSLDSCLKFAQPDSAVLFLEDGVYAVLKGSAVEAKVRSATENKKVYALASDLKARGFADSRVVDGVTLVDYAGFVDLAAECDKVQAWL